MCIMCVVCLAKIRGIIKVYESEQIKVICLAAYRSFVYGSFIPSVWVEDVVWFMCVMRKSWGDYRFCG